ncbi:hypothetical protein KQX54_005084 [Cotesia glomerata]|uniref:Uncharacterized protein n=1 Tax=Cotesia glomerata TaxID=32391 RepID=A0AAV7HYG2_COTGL|nr:hypothetical protein KQX54_005084 [Cotesia glomerata]
MSVLRTGFCITHPSRAKLAREFGKRRRRCVCIITRTLVNSSMVAGGWCMVPEMIIQPGDVGPDVGRYPRIESTLYTGSPVSPYRSGPPLLRFTYITLIWEREQEQEREWASQVSGLSRDFQNR